MPRLPDLDSLGARPVPVSRRGVASNPRAGAVGQAVEGFGETVSRIGRERREKDDRLNYAAARAQLLRADIAARQELENEPDFEKWETGYDERMTRARGEAAQLIGSRSDRALFERDTEEDLIRGRAAVTQAVNGRRRDGRIATLDTASETLADVARSATDDATREAAYASASDLFRGAFEHGDITAVEMGDRSRKFVQNDIVQRIETMHAAEDLDGAMRLFEANRDKLDTDTERRMGNLLSDAAQNREALILGEQYYQSGGLPIAPAEEGAPFAVAPSLPTMIAITAQSESGNRERDANGRLITSPAGAQGRMQVMPATARDPGHGIRPWDGKSDADRSRVGEELLAALMRKYGDPAKAWAAYNWGEGRVDRAIRDHGDSWLTHAPSETRNYVRANVAALGSDAAVAASAGPQRRDLRQINAAIDADAEAQRWSPEKTERVKAQAARLVARDDALLDREQADAYEAALAKAETLGENFTDPSQLGDDYYRASETQQRTLRGIAESNRAGGVAANGADAVSLDLMRYYQPAEFKALNLAEYQGRVTPAELAQLLQQQAIMRTSEGQWSPQAGIVTALNYGLTMGGATLEPKEKAEVLRAMESEAREMYRTNGGRPLTQNDYQSIFRNVVVERTARHLDDVPGLPGEMGQAALMPQRDRERYTRELRQNGLPVNEENLLRLYQAGLRR